MQNQSICYKYSHFESDGLTGVEHQSEILIFVKKNLSFAEKKS